MEPVRYMYVWNDSKEHSSLLLSTNRNTEWHSTLPSCAVIGWNICKREKFLSWCLVLECQNKGRKSNSLNLIFIKSSNPCWIWTKDFFRFFLSLCFSFSFSVKSHADFHLCCFETKKRYSYTYSNFQNLLLNVQNYKQAFLLQKHFYPSLSALWDLCYWEGC